MAPGLHVQGRWFKDARGDVVRLKSINWEGFNDASRMLHGLDRQSFATIIHHVKDLGFNSVRLVYANEILRSTELTRDEVVVLNPALRGMAAKDAFAYLVDQITGAGLFVILDNHQHSFAFYPESDGMWFTEHSTEADWIADWATVATMFRGKLGVVGYELRNEVRATTIGGTTHVPTWGGGGPDDWKRAQVAAAKEIWRHDPHKIVFMSGLNYQLDLGGVYTNHFTAAELGVTGQPQIAYTAHVYGWLAPAGKGPNHLIEYSPLEQDAIYGESFGFVIVEGKPYTAPLWISELGTSTLYASATDRTEWLYWQHFDNLVKYINRGQLSFAYYNLSAFYPKQPHAQSYDCLASYERYFTHKSEYEAGCSTYGLFTAAWDALYDDWRIPLIRQLTK